MKTTSTRINIIGKSETEKRSLVRWLKSIFIKDAPSIEEYKNSADNDPADIFHFNDQRKEMNYFEHISGF